MQQQQARGGRVAAAVEAPELATHQRISMFTEPLPGEVCIEEFERFAIDRLRGDDLCLFHHACGQPSIPSQLLYIKMLPLCLTCLAVLAHLLTHLAMFALLQSSRASRRPGTRGSRASSCRYGRRPLLGLQGHRPPILRGSAAFSVQAIVVQLADKHLKGSTPEETRWKDSVSHFVLRLAYCRHAFPPTPEGCWHAAVPLDWHVRLLQGMQAWLRVCRTEDLRRWFLQQECDLFRHRFRNEVPSSQVCWGLAPTWEPTSQSMVLRSCSKQRAAWLSLHA